MTHGAISRQIQLLEKWIGTPLFARQGRGQVLTPAGQALARELNKSFADITAACSDVQHTGRRFVVTVECPTTLAMYWLMPRLATLEAILCNIKINLVTRMSDERQDKPNSDIVISRGKLKGSRRNDTEEKELLVEEMGLIAAPEFLARPQISEATDIITLPMVAAVTRPRDWPEWCRQAGVLINRLQFRQSFEHSFIALNAVRCGIGTMIEPCNILLGSHQAAHFQALLPEIRFPARPIT